MAQAYTPGLKVTPHATLRKRRRLPIAGQVLVEVGQAVRGEDVVARAMLPGKVSAVNVVERLAIIPEAVGRHMLKGVGQAVAEGEVIAQTNPWIKWLRATARSPVDGMIETVSQVTGQVMIRMAPRPVDVRAYVDGVVVEVEPGQGVVVETSGALVQGILGLGGEVAGELAVACDGPEAVLNPADLGEQLAGKIVLAGALVTAEAYGRAKALGVAALVCGGFHDRDLRQLLGYDLGVAVTGHEPIRPILILTEGFGQIPMARRTWDLLAAHAGRRASASGATQIRAGVLRPEIIIPETGDATPPIGESSPTLSGLAVGSPVRIIRHPNFGRLGVVRALPAEPAVLESEVRARVVQVELSDGQLVTVPRANVEVIET
jgi:hypothetical protein